MIFLLCRITAKRRSVLVQPLAYIDATQHLHFLGERFNLPSISLIRSAILSSNGLSFVKSMYIVVLTRTPSQPSGLKPGSTIRGMMDRRWVCAYFASIFKQRRTLYKRLLQRVKLSSVSNVD